MKKNKKLPKYNIGRSRYTGYQRSMGIGAASFNSQLGENLGNEVNAMRQSLIPNAIARLGQNAQYPLLTLLNTIHLPATISGFTTVTNPLASTATNAASNFTTNFAGQGLGASLLNNNAAILDKVPQATVNAGKTVLNAAGKVAAGLGTAYGAYNVVNDLAHAGDTITTGQIANSRGTNTITTAGGNTYTERTGPDGGAAMDYERQAATSKKVGLTLDSMGLGASIGSFFGGPIGMGIGAVGGALIGGLGSLFGFGDNEEEVNNRLKLVTDVTSMLNRQSEGLAKNQDVRDEFYGSAANGKMPGFHNGKANARVSNGEVVGNFEDGYVRVPGSKNNKDNVKTHLGKEDFVISNKHGLSDYAWLTGDIPGALAALSYLQKTGQMNKYKNGRLPKFDTGTWLYANAILPHMFGYLLNLALLNSVDNSDRTAPQAEVPDAGASRAINDMYADRIDERDYLRLAYDLYRLQLWEGRRTPGLGLGGRMLYATNLGTQAQRQLADTRLKINELNRAQRNAARQMQLQNALNARAHELDNFWKTAAMRQQINSAYEKYRAQIPLNQYNILSSLGSNLSQIYNTNNALDIQNRMLELYDRQAKTDELKANAYINSLGNNTTQNNSTWTPPMWLQRRGYIPSTYDTSGFNWSIRS